MLQQVFKTITAAQPIHRVHNVYLNVFFYRGHISSTYFHLLLFCLLQELLRVSSFIQYIIFIQFIIHQIIKIIFTHTNKWRLWPARRCVKIIIQYITFIWQHMPTSKKNTNLIMPDNPNEPSNSFRILNGGYGDLSLNSGARTEAWMSSVSLPSLELITEFSDFQ